MYTKKKWKLELFSFERNNAFSDWPITERQAIQGTNENSSQTHEAGLKHGKTCSLLLLVARSGAKNPGSTIAKLVSTNVSTFIEDPTRSHSCTNKPKQMMYPPYLKLYLFI